MECEANHLNSVCLMDKCTEGRPWSQLDMWLCQSMVLHRMFVFLFKKLTLMVGEMD